MSSVLIKAFVTKADGDIVRVKLLDDSFENDLKKIGFVYNSDLSDYTLSVAGNREKAELFSKLRGLDVCFSDGKEWCPAEVFNYLRLSGLISGVFRKISWKEPGDYHIVDD